ncbi:MAG: hypothetical protein JXA21_05140 [Anaerolineae bacterium]|nr:hypothetical protein [Anaerolineae bacterium]
MFKWLLPTIVALLVCVLVLLGLLLPVSPEGQLGTALSILRIMLVRWAAVLGAFALLVGFFSLLAVHVGRLRHGANKIASLLIVISAVGSFLLMIPQGPYGVWPQYLLNNVLIPGESALLALTAVTLLLAAMRIFRVRRDLGSFLFVVVVLISLFITVPYGYPKEIQRVSEFLNGMAGAGMRGLVIGVALGTTLTGIRIILGIDRPHSEE